MSTEPTYHGTDFTLPAEAMNDFLADDRLIKSEHYYAAGDVDLQPVVLIMKRVSEEEYKDLAGDPNLDSKHTVKGKDK